MLVAVTGTPGTGKSILCDYLEKKGYTILRLNEIALNNNFISGFDKKRNCYIIDVDKLSKYIKDKYKDYKGIIFLDGHFSHLLENLDKIIILRTKPVELKKRLLKKKWKKEKIRENLEAEILDIITLEALEKHSINKIYEIDTTREEIQKLGKITLNIIHGRFKNDKTYAVGNINWLTDKNLKLLG
ncbi:MAG: NMP kinase [Thermoplasmata archaeon]|nr:MAG: NMP kinase [Thermoplasmata archaeon]